MTMIFLAWPYVILTGECLHTLYLSEQGAMNRFHSLGNESGFFMRKNKAGVHLFV
jgi:hypothetical protein